ncbi:type II toxin-antitoxin system death-on-curing family toxin [Streptomyces sp. NPDC000594]|uniref:type II toxin-antitoxin system death-on-curing family toxin n=1 Tax=Streptomyces sp. NPDC000594 TaxID=3154261 RepID=UPI00332FB346
MSFSTDPGALRYPTDPEALELAEIAFGGPVGVRDPGLLSSAVHRPRSRMLGVEAYPGLFDKAAALLQALASNHPLVDGNKRLAWLGTVVFLHLNGVDMTDIDQDEAYRLMIEVASGELVDITVISHRLGALHDTV